MSCGNILRLVRRRARIIARSQPAVALSLVISISVGAVCALAPPSLKQLLRARTMYADTQARVKCEPVTQLGHLGAFSCKDW